MAIGLSVTFVPLLIRNNLNNRCCDALIHLPFAMTLLMFCVIPMSMLGLAGAFMGLALFHH